MKSDEPLQKLAKALLNPKLYPIIKEKEQELLNFLKSPDASMHTKLLNKQERWVFHQLSDLYKLSHSVQGNDDKREMTLNKLSDTIM